MNMWISLLPLSVLPEYFTLLEAHGVRRLVVLSSTSRFTKLASSDPAEQLVAFKLAEAENALMEWTSRQGVEWVLLRPTLIYGFGKDKNIAEIARFISRFGFFPLLGAAAGLRQPVHAVDVAEACISALTAGWVKNRAFSIAGGEILSYRAMVRRIFSSMCLPPRLVSVPLTVIRPAVACLRCWPRYRHWSVAMAERMNSDLVFDCAEAARDLGFRPRGFSLTEEDLDL